MPSQRGPESATPVHIPSLEVSTASSERLKNSLAAQQPFHEILSELLAQLAMRHGCQPVGDAPNGTLNSTSAARQLGGRAEYSFPQEIGVALPDILDAISLIFSKSRKGRHVVASALQQQPLWKGSAEMKFTFYLTINNGSWPEHYTDYSKIWMSAVNDPVGNTAPDFSSSLWGALTNICAERIRDYAKQARNDMLGADKEPIVGLESIYDVPLRIFNASRPTEDVVNFYEKLTRLLKDVREKLEKLKNLKKLGIESSPMDVLIPLTEECWHFMQSYGDGFRELYSHLLSRSGYHGRKCRSARKYLKSVENLAKVPRAFITFTKFCHAIASQKACLSIELLRFPFPGPSDYNGSTTSKQVGYGSVDNHIDKITVSDANRDRAKGLVKKLRNAEPHCEIQLLRYFNIGHGQSSGNRARTGIWNVIGCSKRPCLVCAKLLREADFLFKESHGKIYFQQLLSIEKWLGSNSSMRAAIKSLNRELAVSVWGRDYTEPDSPTCLDWSLSIPRDASGSGNAGGSTDNGGSGNTSSSTSLSTSGNISTTRDAGSSTNPVISEQSGPTHPPNDNDQAPALPQEHSQDSHRDPRSRPEKLPHGAPRLDESTSQPSQWEDEAQTRSMREALTQPPEDSHELVNTVVSSRMRRLWTKKDA